uniref:Uncharacterized protein n=1 Tax=Anopheles merus TaxID=30066 RepID=A0A182V4L9_ANOME
MFKSSSLYSVVSSSSSLRPYDSTASPSSAPSSIRSGLKLNISLPDSPFCRPALKSFSLRSSSFCSLSFFSCSLRFFHARNDSSVTRVWLGPSAARSRSIRSTSDISSFSTTSASFSSDQFSIVSFTSASRMSTCIDRFSDLRSTAGSCENLHLSPFVQVPCLKKAHSTDLGSAPASSFCVATGLNSLASSFCSFSFFSFSSFLALVPVASPKDP